MALQFCIGSSGAGKSKLLYDNLIQRSLQEPERQFFIIVPDQFTMQTQKELVERHPKGGIMNIDVLSFGRLTHRIFEETGGDFYPILDDVGKSLILRRIAASHMEELPVLGGNIKRLGYIHEVKSAISEFMQYGIGNRELEELIAFSNGRGSLHNKLKDLAVLYDAFQQEIADRFVTTEGQLGLLAEALERSALIRNSIIVFDGFTGFTPIQNRVIQKLMVLAAEVQVAVIMDGSENPLEISGEQELFAFSKKMIGSLRRIAMESEVDIKPDMVLTQQPVPRFLHNPGMAHLEQELFRYRNRSFAGQQDAIHIVEASNPVQEVRQVCLEIRRLVREKKYQYRDIAVVTGDLAAYGDYVEEKFADFEIPCYLDATKGIALNPLTEYIRSALQIFLKNFSYESVFAFLKSGLADISMEETDVLENYVLCHGIRGKKAWSELFTRRRVVKEAQEEQITKEWEAVNRTRERVMDILAPLSEAASCAKDYVNQMYDFLLSSRVYEKLSEMERVFEESGDLVKAKEYGQIYRLVMELLEQIYDLLGEETLTMQEFADILDAGFGEIQVGTIPQNIDRILVGDIERTRLKEIKVLFFLGVNDGNIPKNSAKGGIISDIDREFLAQSRWEMAPSPRQQMYIQRLYLYMNMTKPSDRLYLSYVKVNEEGKAVRPAYLIHTLKKLFPALETEIPEKLPGQMQIEVRGDALSVLAQELREYAKGNTVEEPFLFSLYEACEKEEAGKGEARRLVESAFFRYQNSPLGEEIAHALYGSVLKSSVSRLEQYASCAYSYFLQYGLSLKERELFGFEAVDMGTLFHGILEQFADMLAERGLDWFSFSREQGEEMLEEAVERQAAVYGSSILFSSAKYRYVVARVKRILMRTVFMLQSQLQKGKFKPEHFEVSFSSLSDIEAVNISLSEKEKMYLQGRIDRIDTCREEDTVYVKIIDYKSGNKNLDIAAIYYGLQLQLVVYMNAAVEMLKKKEKGKQVIPAAMLYYHISDPLIKAEDGSLSEEMLNEKIRESLRMKGLVNEAEAVLTRLDQTFEGKSAIIPVERKKDGSLSSRSSTLPQDELTIISNYVNNKIKSLGHRILSGDIEKSPYAYGESTGCDYCVYQSVCGFKKELAGYAFNRCYSMSAEEAIEKMRQEGDK